MNTQFELTLSNVGFTVFDPLVLEDFVRQNDLSGDLFDSFTRNPVVGDRVIREGIVLPVYSIPPLDYQLVITFNASSRVEQDWVKFTTQPFPLVVTSGNLVASDIDALLNWDYNFYNSIDVSTEKRTQNAFVMQPGNYKVVIVGFCEKTWTGSGPINKGYELLFSQVSKLPIINNDVDSDSTNYIVYGHL